MSNVLEPPPEESKICEKIMKKLKLPKDIDSVVIRNTADNTNETKCFKRESTPYGWCEIKVRYFLHREMPSSFLLTIVPSGRESVTYAYFGCKSEYRI